MKKLIPIVVFSLFANNLSAVAPNPHAGDAYRNEIGPLADSMVQLWTAGLCIAVVMAVGLCFADDQDPAAENRLNDARRIEIGEFKQR